MKFTMLRSCFLLAMVQFQIWEDYFGSFWNHSLAVLNWHYDWTKPSLTHQSQSAMHYGRQTCCLKSKDAFTFWKNRLMFKRNIFFPLSTGTSLQWIIGNSFLGTKTSPTKNRVWRSFSFCPPVGYVIVPWRVASFTSEQNHASWSKRNKPCFFHVFSEGEGFGSAFMDDSFLRFWVNNFPYFINHSGEAARLNGVSQWSYLHFCWTGIPLPSLIIHPSWDMTPRCWWPLIWLHCKQRCWKNPPKMPHHIHKSSIQLMYMKRTFMNQGVLNRHGELDLVHEPLGIQLFCPLTPSTCTHFLSGSSKHYMLCFQSCTTNYPLIQQSHIIYII